jgi:hypothetical protein
VMSEMTENQPLALARGPGAGLAWRSSRELASWHIDARLSSGLSNSYDRGNRRTVLTGTSCKPQLGVRAYSG